MHPQDTKCTPQQEQESIFRTVFAGWIRFGGIFRRSLRATTKKRSSTLLAKSAPPDKILATPMVGGCNEYQPNGGGALQLGSEDRYGSCKVC